MSDTIDLTNILNNISSEYNIPIGDLMKYAQKKSNKKKNSLCKARKQDGLQCTRRAKCNSLFCGKHIEKRNYGCVSDNSEYIECKKIKNNDKIYFVDEYGIVYEKINLDKYSIVGTQKNNIIIHIK